jgi:hypothetical protein
MSHHTPLKLLSIGLLWTLTLSLSACGSSANVPITTDPGATAPSITAQPAAQSISVGQTATFAVTATGSTPLTYQWQ